MENEKIAVGICNDAGVNSSMISLNFITNTGISYTRGMKGYIRGHVDKLQTFLIQLSPSSLLQASFKKAGDMNNFEIIAFINKVAIKGTGKDKSFYDAVDRAFAVLKKNLVKYKEKHSEIHKASKETLKEVKNKVCKEHAIVKQKEVDCIAMSECAAIEEMERGDYDFFLFLDKVTLAPSVLYRRHDCDYGVIKMKQIGTDL